MKKISLLIIFCVLAVLYSACQTSSHPHMSYAKNLKFYNKSRNFQPVDYSKYQIPAVIELSSMPDLASIMPKLLRKRVIFIGETHNRFDHHQNQLEVIRRLNAKQKKFAIGLEFFQQPFQKYLDRYIAGKISEREFLYKSEYFKRWRIDYRNYRDILRYAKKHAIPLVALDISTEMKKRVSEVGVEGLSVDERKSIPEKIDYSNKDYSDFLRSVFQEHPHIPGQDFTRFEEVQLVRDETMAERAANYLKVNPEYKMIILAGTGHIAFSYGIPARLKRRVNVDSAIILHSMFNAPSSALADYVFIEKPIILPKPGRLGVVLGLPNEGEVSINKFSDNSPAQRAGIKSKDTLVKLDDDAIEQLVDVKLALLEKLPGDKVKVKVLRKNWLDNYKELDFEVILD